MYEYKARAKTINLLQSQRRQIQIFRPLLVYNASIPAVLKNALDWASRSEKGGSAKADVFRTKKFVLMSASPGRGGGKRALMHLRAILEDIGASEISSQISIPQADLYFAEKERKENLALNEELKQFIIQSK